MQWKSAAICVRKLLIQNRMRIWMQHVNSERYCSWQIIVCMWSAVALVAFIAFFFSCNVFVRAVLAGDAPINTFISIYNILNIAILYESTRFLTALADEIV